MNLLSPSFDLEMVSDNTKRNLACCVLPYVSKPRPSTSPNKSNLVHLDLGRNPDGYSPKVKGFFEEFQTVHARDPGYLSDYPDIHNHPLLEAIAELHGIPRDWIEISAGLDQMIDMVYSVFLQQGTTLILTDPGFFLFSTYGKRHGGIPTFITLDPQGDFTWNQGSTLALNSLLKTKTPKVLTLANPNNPTGRYIEPGLIKEIVHLCAQNNTICVIDEAYGEYTDSLAGPVSASSLLGSYQNLIVLRTFSKAHGLASIRMGYCLTANPIFHRALTLYRPYFPVTRFSLDVATWAIQDQAFLETTRTHTKNRMDSLRNDLGTRGMRLWPSETGIALLSHHGFSSIELAQNLQNNGILVARINGIASEQHHCVRISPGTNEENATLLQVCNNWDAL